MTRPGNQHADLAGRPCKQRLEPRDQRTTCRELWKEYDGRATLFHDRGYLLDYFLVDIRLGRSKILNQEAVFSKLECRFHRGVGKRHERE